MENLPSTEEERALFLEKIEWTTEPINIFLILPSVDFPCLLRAVGSGYSDNHIRIREGDILLIENCIFSFVLKARLCFCDPQNRFVSYFAKAEDIFLPIGCQQKGFIKPLLVDFNKEIFHCPNDLGPNFPRFIRLLDDVHLFHGQNDEKVTLMIPKDEILEVLRWEYKNNDIKETAQPKLTCDTKDPGLRETAESLYEIYQNWTNISEFSLFKEKRLICSWNDNIIAFYPNELIELQGVEDKTPYKIYDITERFSSPQGFLFSRPDAQDSSESVYDGCYLLKELCPVVVMNGHHIKKEGNFATEKFRLPLLLEDWTSLQFCFGKMPRRSSLNAKCLENGVDENTTRGQCTSLYSTSGKLNVK